MAGISSHDRVLKYMRAESSGNYVSSRDVAKTLNLSVKAASNILAQLLDEEYLEYQARNKGSKSNLNLWKWKENNREITSDNPIPGVS
jgi:CTP-dependent riboflavin kinase